MFWLPKIVVPTLWFNKTRTGNIKSNKLCLKKRLICQHRMTTAKEISQKRKCTFRNESAGWGECIIPQLPKTQGKGCVQGRERSQDLGTTERNDSRRPQINFVTCKDLSFNGNCPCIAFSYYKDPSFDGSWLFTDLAFEKSVTMSLLNGYGVLNRQGFWKIGEETLELRESFNGNSV